jgi:DNA modification methylase
MSFELHHGDCLEVMKLMPSCSIDLVVTSPPYNCRKEYGEYKDQLAWDSYYHWMSQVITECYRLLVDGGVLAVVVPDVVKWQREHAFADSWHDFDPTYKNRFDGVAHLGKGRIEPLGFRIRGIMEAVDPHLREHVIWVKGSEGNAVAGGYQIGCDSDPFLRATHETIYLGSKSRWFHRGGTGRRGLDAMPYLDYCKDVWFIPPISNSQHPAPFPVEIPLRLIRLFTHAPDAVIFDPFTGSGTTGVAALIEGKRFIGIEQDADFIAVARERLHKQSEPLFIAA